MVRVWRSLCLLCFVGIQSMLWGQLGFLQGLDRQALSDTAKIDLLNDHAWSLTKAAPDSAEAYAMTAIARAKEAGNYAKGLINAHILLGILNKDRGYYGISVENYLQALQLAEDVGDSLRISGCLNNIGSVYFEQGNYPKALEYFQRSLDIENKIGKDKGQTSIRLVNIGDAYQKLDSLDKAAAFYYNSLLIEEELKNEDGMFYARLGIGRVDTRKGNLSNAETELRRALGYAQNLQNLPGICEAQVALSELLLAQGRLPAALTALDSALHLAQTYHYQGLAVQAMGIQYQVLKAQGNLGAANTALENYYSLREQLNSAQVNSRIGELQTTYELEKKEQEIARFKENQLAQAMQMKYDRKLRNYLLFSVCLTIVLVFYNLYRSRRPNS